MSAGDVTVFGLVVGTHVLTDIGMDVPHGHTVTIPAAKAQKSKDLWRAISQKCIFLIQSGPYAHRNVDVTGTYVPPPPVHQFTADPAMSDRQQALEDENRQLKETLIRQRQEAEAAEKRQQGKLDSILELLRSGAATHTIVMSQGVQGAPGQPRATPIEDDAPTFIPAVIRPENAETRIEAKKAESDSTLSGASDKLRELRRKAKP
jgi:hypothetical protein